MVGRGAHALLTARSPRIPPSGRPRGGAIQRRDDAKAVARRRRRSCPRGPGGTGRLCRLGAAGGGGRLGLTHRGVRHDRRPAADRPRTDPNHDVEAAPGAGLDRGVGHLRLRRSATALRPGHPDLRPPFRRIWTFRGRALLEFPPAVAYGRLYLPVRRPLLRAGCRSGQDGLGHRTRRCGWASPAVQERVDLRHVHRAADRPAAPSPGATASSSPTTPTAAGSSGSGRPG